MSEKKATTSRIVRKSVSAIRGGEILSSDRIEKDIWGAQWRAFEGIESGGDNGVREIQDNPADYDLARVAESYVYACERVRGDAISQAPLQVYEIKPNGRGDAVQHPALDVISNTNPFGYVDGTARLLRYTLMSLDLHGRSAWKLAFDNGGHPAEIYWQIPTKFTPISDPDTFFGGIRSRQYGKEQVFPADQVVYFASDNPKDPLLGQSRVSIARQAINLRLYSGKSNMDFFKNSMRPDWILSGPFSNTEENIERIKRQIRHHYSGERNREPMVLGEGATAHVLTANAKDAEWLAQQRLCQEEISSIFGVPIMYLNNWDKATLDNVKVAKQSLWHDSMIPECDQLAHWLTRSFLWRFWPETQGKLTFGFNYHLIEGLGDDVAQIWERSDALMQTIAKLMAQRAITPNQAQPIILQLLTNLGLEAEPGSLPTGDTFVDLWTKIPVEQMSMQAVIDAMASRGANPQLVENIPGAESAGDALYKPVPAHMMPKPPPPPPPTDTPPTETPPPAPADGPAEDGGGTPKNVIDLDAFRQAIAADREELVKSLADRLTPPQAIEPIFKGPHPATVRDTRLAPIQDKLTRRLKRYFQDRQTESLRTLRAQKRDEAPETKTVSVPLYDQEQSKRLLVEIVQEGAAQSGAEAYTSAAEDYGLGVQWSADSPWLDQYMGRRMPMIAGIDETTANSLADALITGGEAGETMEELAARVTGLFGDAISNRAAAIARTETIQAYGHASLAAYEDAGIAKAQMYDGDDDVMCRDVNGIEVTLNEARELMDHEHPNGSRGMAPVVTVPGETIDGSKAVAKVAPDVPADPTPMHEHGKHTPVLVFDVHKTLTPATSCPVKGSPAYPGVKDFLDEMVSRGCCIHVASAALDKGDPAVQAENAADIAQWLQDNELPVSLVSAKGSGDLYIDDRAVRVPGNPDWEDMADKIQDRLADKYLLNEDGQYVPGDSK